MTTQGITGWRRFTIYGLVVYLALDITIGTMAYMGSLWAFLPGIPHFDFAGHFVLIGGLAFFLDGVLDYRPVTRRVPWLRLAPTAVLTVAGIEELLQALTPRRTSSVSDFVADVLGVYFLSWVSGLAAAKFGGRQGTQNGLVP